MRDTSLLACTPARERLLPLPGFPAGGDAMTTSLKLYQTVDALNVVREWIYEHDDEIRNAEGALPDELAALLEQAETDLETKAESVALFVRELYSNAKAVRDERDRLDARVRHYERAAESLKDYLKFQLERSGIAKVEGKLATVRLQKSPPSIKALLDQDALARMKADPATTEYVETIPQSFRVDNDTVRAAWKEGRELPAGIEVVQSNHVRIV
jgi:hypothetical protein